MAGKLLSSRLATLVRLVGEEAGTALAGRDLILARLVEVLLIEALRAARWLAEEGR